MLDWPHLNNKDIKLVAQDLFWNIVGIRPRLSDIRISESKSCVYIFGVNCLTCDRNQHYKNHQQAVSNYGFCKSLENVLDYQFNKNTKKFLSEFPKKVREAIQAERDKYQ